MRKTPLTRKTPLKRKLATTTVRPELKDLPLNQSSSTTLGKKEAKPTLRPPPPTEGIGSPEVSKPRRTSLKRSQSTTTSKAQRDKARDEPCIVTGTTKEFNVVDPAHLWAAARGGCHDPLCVVPLERSIHQRFDNGDFDLLPYLVKRRVPELQHALEHADGDLIGLLQRLTGARWSSS